MQVSLQKSSPRTSHGSLVNNLLREGRPQERTFLVGNVMIDVLHYFLPLAQQSRIGE
jgi:UDP-N-acetylglucosamine 2-epimerase